MKKITMMIMLMSLFITSIYMVRGSGPTIFIDGKPVFISSKYIEGKLWVPLPDFCQKAGMAYTQSGSQHYVFKVPGKTGAVAGKEKISSRYYLKITNSFGDFSLRVRLNNQYVGSFNTNGGAEITPMVEEGKNTLTVNYEQKGDAGSFNLLVFRRSGNKDKSVAKWEAMWPFDDETSGTKTFIFNEP